MKYLLSLFLLVMSFPVLSGSGSGKIMIQYAGAWEGKTLLFFYTETRTDSPECNTYNGRWVVNLATEQGKEQYRFLLNAEQAGKSIKVMGTNDCNLWGNSETVKSVSF